MLLLLLLLLLFFLPGEVSSRSLDACPLVEAVARLLRLLDTFSILPVLLVAPVSLFFLISILVFFCWRTYPWWCWRFLAVLVLAILGGGVFPFCLAKLEEQAKPFPTTAAEIDRFLRSTKVTVWDAVR